MSLREEESFALSRPVGDDDWNYINAAIVDALKIPNHQKTQDYGHNVVLLRRRELYLTMSQSGILTDDPDENLAAILEPTIDSSLQPIEVGVDSVKFFGNHKDWRNVALVVGDANATLSDERHTYLERARGYRTRNDRFEFNVTLARIRPELATTSLLAQLSADMPSTVTLTPMIITQSDRRPARKITEHTIDNILPPFSRATNKDVRTLRPIPQSFLASLRPPKD